MTTVGVKMDLNLKGGETVKIGDWDGGVSENVEAGNFGEKGGEEKRNVEVGMVVMDFELLNGCFGESAAA